MARLAVLIAHQGGWDEWLFAIGPIVVIIAVLAVVKRRVERARPPIDDETAPES